LMRNPDLCSVRRREALSLAITSRRMDKNKFSCPALLII
jgi:hypothetical protein